MELIRLSLANFSQLSVVLNLSHGVEDKFLSWVGN